MAAELLPCQGAHNTEKLQVGWKAQWRRVTMLKISKCFMQAWCIIVREMKCVCSELKLLAGCLVCRDIEMLTGREKLLDFMYTGFFLCHGLSFLELASIFQMSQVLSFHVGGHVWCVGSWDSWETAVLGFRWGSATSSSLLGTWVHWLWNY